ncbi:hypothetical protein [Paenibacillus macerans]|uniref:hypothetical protein n=1 Tax=Paenibacillus macerans TaxID=44252 RepID=UPI00203FAE1C|nr:hypothetical protein [Paenibacillus macerans]MCM3699245.1 hypothetical protein [Paenibacillus macerans]
MSSAIEITRDIVVATVQNESFIKAVVSGSNKGEATKPIIDSVVELYNSVFEAVSKSMS